jgi:hypothetical protein
LHGDRRRADTGAELGGVAGHVDAAGDAAAGTVTGVTVQPTPSVRALANRAVGL